MNVDTNNRFVKEMKTVVRDNPQIDTEQMREWQRISKILDSIPPEPEPEPPEPPRLQPIPLKMFEAFGRE